MAIRKEVREISEDQKNLVCELVDIFTHPGATPALNNLAAQLTCLFPVEKRAWVTKVEVKDERR